MVAPAFTRMKLRDMQRRMNIDHHLKALRAAGSACRDCRFFVLGWCARDRERGPVKTASEDLCLLHQKKS